MQGLDAEVADLKLMALLLCVRLDIWKCRIRARQIAGRGLQE
jgi:hypothetical protein